MTAHWPFSKMHGLGNDFAVFEQSRAPNGVRMTSEMAHKICDRHRGVGADQILLLSPPSGNGATVRMDIWNPDGSTAEMCGNGVRAVGLYLEKHLRLRGPFSIETLAGPIEVQKAGSEFRVKMGEPRFPSKKPSLVEGFDVVEVDMGNPHAVIFLPVGRGEERVSSVDLIPLDQVGPKIERNPHFPHRTNVEFVEVVDGRNLRVRVWERGAGITLACGTGACAVAAAAIAGKHAGTQDGMLDLHLPGGRLRMEWKGPGHPIYMTGPAIEVFRGEWPLPTDPCLKAD